METPLGATYFTAAAVVFEGAFLAGLGFGATTTSRFVVDSKNIGRCVAGSSAFAGGLVLVVVEERIGFAFAGCFMICDIGYTWYRYEAWCLSSLLSSEARAFLSAVYCKTVNPRERYLSYCNNATILEIS